MKRERRQSVRQLVGADVRLYHPALGSLPARVEDWSQEAVRLSAEIPPHNGHDFSSAVFLLGAKSMDVIFTLQFVRLDETGLVLRFVDDGDVSR